MNCNKCQSELVSVVEIECKHCSKCLPSIVKNWEELVSSLDLIKLDNSALQTTIDQMMKARERRLDLDACFEGGKEAFSRGFVIEQDPHDQDSDESVMWKNGWIAAAREKETEDMREFIRWDFDLWVHLHELIVNGCDVEELRMKSTLSPVRAMQFLPELLSEDEV
jgi:hypothetical protein